MSSKIKWKISAWLFASLSIFWFVSMLSSCGKGANVSTANLNIKYEVLNLSPDVLPVDIYIRFLKTNNSPFRYSVNQGYFTVPYTDTPFIIRSDRINGGPALLKRSDILTRNAQYSLFITGTLADNSLTTIFTVDTATLPKVGRGKIRFVDASPSGINGLDVYANGTKAFNKIIYPKPSDFVELPIGNYDFQIYATGSPLLLNKLSNVQIDDGKLYTLYAYGYTTRSDSAAFTAAMITNK
ncbi:MAG: DUF4397 domain-containing protein [Mucilaginibacter sp.]